MQRMIVIALGAGLLLGGRAAYGQSGTCTPITSVPFTVSTAGVYCLTGNLAHTVYNSTAITVTASAVVIDFNGYRLRDLSSNRLGTAVNVVSEKNVTIRNGLITEFAAGIVSEAKATIIEDMQLSEIARAIIIGGRGAIIRRNYCRQNDTTFGADTCIEVHDTAFSTRIIDNDIYGAEGLNLGTGIIILGENSFVVGNRIGRLNIGINFGLSGTTKYRDNLTTNVTTPYTVGGINAGNNN